MNQVIQFDQLDQLIPDDDLASFQDAFVNDESFIPTSSAATHTDFQEYPLFLTHSFSFQSDECEINSPIDTINENKARSHFNKSFSSKKKINRSRERQKQELINLRSQVQELEKKFQQLQSVYENRKNIPIWEISRNGPWQQLAKRQINAAHSANDENKMLRLKYMQHANWIRSMQSLLYDQELKHLPIQPKISTPRKVYFLTKLVLPKSSEGVMLQNSLYHAVHETLHIISKYEIHNIRHPTQEMEMRIENDDTSLQCTGVACLISPVSIELALDTFRKMYSLDNVANDLFPNTSTKPAELLAEGTIAVEGTHLIAGTITAYQSYLDSSRAHMVFQFNGEYSKNNREKMRFQETIWVLLESTQNAVNYSTNGNNPHTTIHWISRMAMSSLTDGIEMGISKAEVCDLEGGCKQYYTEHIQHFENLLMEAILEARDVT